MSNRGAINGKAGKVAALAKFSDTLTLSQLGGGGRICHWLCLTYIFFVITPLPKVETIWFPSSVKTYQPTTPRQKLYPSENTIFPRIIVSIIILF